VFKFFQFEEDGERESNSLSCSLLNSAFKSVKLSLGNVMFGFIYNDL
jgi:hypothetical protein